MFILRAARYVRQAHNLKVVDSNPATATNHTNAFRFLTTFETFF